MRRLILTFLAVFLIGMPAYAQVPGGQSETADDTSASEPVVNAARIQERVDRLKISLSSSERTRLTQRCVAAQSKLSAVRAKAAIATDKRRQAYTSLLKMVDALVQRLGSQGIETIAVKTPLVTVQGIQQRFETDYMNYQNSLDDARLLNCQTNPEGFKAALEDARNQRKVLLNDMQNFHEITLTDLRDSLIELSLTVDRPVAPKGDSSGN